MSKLSDEHLAKSCLKGIQEHCRLLFDRHSKELFGFINGQVDRFQDAQDLTQETFINAYKGLKRFKWDSSFKTWLFSIAKNQCRDFYRRQQSQKRSGEEVPIGPEEGMVDPGDDNPGGDVQDQLIKMEMVTNVNEGIQQLPKRQREILELNIVQGFRYAEIAQILNIKISSVGSNKNAALKKLAMILKKYKKDK